MSTSASRRRGGPRPGVTDEQRAEETRQMLLMKQAGASYRAIGTHFGIDPSQVWRRIKKELDLTPMPEAAQLRAIEMLKLDEYERRLQPGIAEGDVKSIGQAVRISERRCRMLGLDLPVRNEITISATEQALADELLAAVDKAVELGGTTSTT